MKFSYLLLAVAGLPLFAFAQTDRSMAAAADANAPVAPLQYQSVFADYVPAKEPLQSPDKGWIRANRTLLGDETVPSASSGQPAAGTSQGGAAHEQKHGQHEHKGMHQ
jgi:hypothetical protein